MADLVFNHYFWLSVIGICLLLMFLVGRPWRRVAVDKNFKKKKSERKWYTEEQMQEKVREIERLTASLKEGCKIPVALPEIFQKIEYRTDILYDLPVEKGVRSISVFGDDKLLFTALSFEIPTCSNYKENKPKN